MYEAREFWQEFSFNEDLANKKEFLRFKATNKFYDMFTKYIG